MTEVVWCDNTDTTAQTSPRHIEHFNNKKSSEKGRIEKRTVKNQSKDFIPWIKSKQFLE